MADKGASFSMPRLSPAPIFILLGMVLGQPFFAWSNRRVAAGDVGALRGVVNNVSNAIGAAFASVVAVGLLGVFLVSTFARPELPPQLETNGRPPGAHLVTAPDNARDGAWLVPTSVVQFTWPAEQAMTIWPPLSSKFARH